KGPLGPPTIADQAVQDESNTQNQDDREGSRRVVLNRVVLELVVLSQRRDGERKAEKNSPNLPVKHGGRTCRPADVLSSVDITRRMQLSTRGSSAGLLQAYRRSS